MRGPHPVFSERHYGGMPLTLVLGPANSAKAGEVLGAYAAATPRGALLVVPTAADAEHYSRELAAQGAVLGSVFTFTGLASEIARRARYDRPRLTALQRERVLKRALRDAELRELEGPAGSPGFAAAAGEMIAELARALVTPQRFGSALAAWAAGDERRAPYARELATIYRTYARELERLDRVDAELHAWRALDALRLAPARWGTDPVFFYGFDDLHPLQRDAVQTLSVLAGVEVTVSLTYEPGRAALLARAQAVEELRPLASAVIELPAVDEHYATESRTALHHLERRLFEPASQRIEPGPAVRLLEAGGERAEAELVAAEVLELLRAGAPGEQIAVVYRSLSRIAPLVRRVFEQYGITVALEHALPLGHTALGRGLLALARCALLPEERTRAQELLAYLRAPGVLARPERADGLERDIRREGLRTAGQALSRLDLSLQEIDSLRAAADPARELVRHARRLLAAPHRAQASVLSAEEELDARALAVTVRALSDCSELGETPSGGELIELLEALQVPAGAPARPGAVLLTEPLAIRARRFRAVFVCGLQEGEFPLQSAPDPFLGNELRRELALASGLRLAPAQDALARERYLFYSCVSRAGEAVVLSYRSADEEGNLALPSPFIADVCELFAADWPQRRRKRLLADVVWPALEAPTAGELARSRAAAEAPVAGEVPSPVPTLSQIALKYVRHREIVSGGALETYGDCPVKWLVERELQPAELEPDSDPLARGSYMHAALEEVLRRLGRAVTPESLPAAQEILGAVVRELPPAVASGSSEGVRRAALAMIEADLRRYLAHEASDGCDWQPASLELRFGFEDRERGEGEALPALELDGVRVRGVIDRIDVDPSGRYAIVRDYKSGSVRPEYQGARWRLDRRLQVALYMLAVRRLLGLEPVAGLYQPLGGKDLRARGVYVEGASVGIRLVATDARVEQELQAELENASARAIALAAQLRGGQLTPCPKSCSRDGCSYPGICRSQ